MDILKIARNGIHKTKIMYKVKLSHAQMKKYLNTLKEEGFIRKDTDV